MIFLPPYERRRTRCRSRTLTTKQLARRWAVKPKVLHGLSPRSTPIPFIKPGHGPRYRLTEIEAFEQAHSSSLAPHSDAE